MIPDVCETSDGKRRRQAVGRLPSWLAPPQKVITFSASFLILLAFWCACAFYTHKKEYRSALSLGEKNWRENVSNAKYKEEKGGRERKSGRGRDRMENIERGREGRHTREIQRERMENMTKRDTERKKS